MNRIIVGAPFGNYLSFPGTTSTLGTFTLQRRAGTFTRLWRAVKTIRYNRRQGSWTSKLRLPSPGILAAPQSAGQIISIHGFDPEDWRKLIVLASAKAGVHPLELNLSCPNVAKTSFTEAVETAKFAVICHGGRGPVIAKMPPVRWLTLGQQLVDVGIIHFHLCNAMTSPGGSISGKPLMQYSLWAIEEFRQRWGNRITIIGGGGVTGPDDVRTYLNAGADHVAIASMLINPLNWWKIHKLVEVCG